MAPGLARPLCALLGAAAAGGAAGATVDDWIPRTEGWRALMKHREAQVKRMPTRQERFDAYMALAAAGVFVRNFTERGYAVVKQPPGVHARLNASLHAAMAKPGAADGLHDEDPIDQIAGARPKFADLGPLIPELLEEMLPYHESWAGGVKLRPQTAYGLRLYGEGNWLTMHFDKMETHVISSILHVDRDVDEPWPIVIEGYGGKTVEVDLQPGEMLFYESSKCMHGRPRPLKGRFYTSLFMHYAPEDWSLQKQAIIDFLDKDGLYEDALPPDESLPAMRMKGTGFYEPDCPGHWCPLAAPPQPPSGGGGARKDSEL